MTKEAFVEIVGSGQSEVPAYFPVSAAQNLKGSASLDDLQKPTALSTEDILNFDGVVLDVRSSAEYGAGHIPNSINIGLGGQFASWAGTLVSIGTPVAVVADTEAQVDEAFTRLARVGIETVKGFILIGDYSGDKKRVTQVTVYEAEKRPVGVQFVDVRRPGEHIAGHAAGTVNLSLSSLRPRTQPPRPRKTDLCDLPGWLPLEHRDKHP